MTATDARVISLADIPLLLLRRLSGSGYVLDSELGLTQDARGLHSAHLSQMLFGRGIYTLVARDDQEAVIGQFRYRPDELNAHITYIAPGTTAESSGSAWLAILDAMAREAGKHGAQSLVAEVEVDSALFVTLRQARFACYLRQTIWEHQPWQATDEASRLPLTEESSADQVGIVSLICSTIPALQQGIAQAPAEAEGLVYRKDGQVEAYIAYSEGRYGVYVIPYIHPDASAQAAAILASAIAHIHRAQRVPVYVSVRSYQTWLEAPLAALGFAPYTEQAILVKHIAAGVKHPGFSRARFNAAAKASSYWTHLLEHLED